MPARRGYPGDWSTNDRSVGGAAKCALDRSVRAGAGAYDRMRDLPGLIRLDPFAPVPDTADAAKAIVAKLQSALRAERNRARSGHWTYDLNRHIALRQAYLAETGRLAAITDRHP
jgi:hypothetical protein